MRHLIGAAAAWGGNPPKDAIHLNVTPAKNDGTTVYKLNVKDVPVDGFWSITVYDAQGYLQANPYNAYSLNNITAKKNDDGSFAIQFGGCDGKIPNCVPIMKRWNYTVRLCRPRPDTLTAVGSFLRRHRPFRSAVVQVSRTPGLRIHPRALAAGVREAPRHEIAGSGAPTVQRALWGFSGGHRGGGGSGGPK